MVKTDVDPKNNVIQLSSVLILHSDFWVIIKAIQDFIVD